MPCNSDHLMPTDRERKSKEAAELIVYVFSRAKLNAPAWAKVAAQDCYGSANGEGPKDIIGFLCDFLKAMTKAKREAMIYGRPKERLCRRLADWWEEHLKDDAR